MSLDPAQVATWVVVPALARLEPRIPLTKQAVQMVLGTAITESRLQYLDQIDKAAKPGPAYGLWQMERPTFEDHLKRLGPALEPGVFGYLSVPPSVEDLHWNLRLGAAMCRVLYWHALEKLPEAGDAEGMARLWKLRYNTPLGKGRAEEAFLYFDRACQAYP